MLAGEGAHDPAKARIDAEVAADRTLRANGIGMTQIPRPRAKTVGFAGERANRTDLGCVAREVRRVRAAVLGTDQAAVAAFDHNEIALLRYFGVEAGAAAAQNAALFVQNDCRTEVDGLGLVQFRLCQATGTRPVGHGEILKIALTALVANRAI